MSKSLRDLQPKLARVTSTATRLWSKAQGWTEGTTLGSGDGGAPNPNGVVAGGVHRRLVFWPRGRNPIGVDGHCRAITQGWHGANPWLCATTPLGLEFWLILRLRDKWHAKVGDSRKALRLSSRTCECRGPSVEGRGQHFGPSTLDTRPSALDTRVWMLFSWDFTRTASRGRAR